MSLIRFSELDLQNVSYSDPTKTDRGLQGYANYANGPRLPWLQLEATAVFDYDSSSEYRGKICLEASPPDLAAFRALDRKFIGQATAFKGTHHCIVIEPSDPKYAPFVKLGIAKGVDLGRIVRGSRLRLLFAHRGYYSGGIGHGQYLKIARFEILESPTPCEQVPDFLEA